MKILVDENIPLMTVKALEEMGHQVRDLRGTDKEGSSDETIWQIAQEEKRLLITTDKGFAKYRGEGQQGILMVCLRQPSRHQIHDRVLLAVNQFGQNEWLGLVVMMRDAVRSVRHPRHNH